MPEPGIAFFFYAFVTLLAMINPVEAAAAFDSLTLHDSPQRQQKIALRSTLVAALILLGFGLAGNALFRALGITLAAFQIAGGLLLLRVGFNMVFAQQTDSDQVAQQQATVPRKSDPSVFPLAIPIITGPGALTAIVPLFGKTHGNPFGIAGLILTALIVLAITYGAMRASQALTKFLGETGVDAVGRLAGIVVAAIAVQLVINGMAQITRGAIVAESSPYVATTLFCEGDHVMFARHSVSKRIFTGIRLPLGAI